MSAKNPLDESALSEHGAVKPSERQTFAEASRAVRDGKPQEAAALIDAKLEAEGGVGSLSLRALRAKLDYLMKDYVTAAERYADVANEAEDMPSLRLNQALCLLRAERWEQAFTVLFRLLSQSRRQGNEHANEARLWGYLGVALEHMGRREDAETAYLAGGYDPAARRVRRARLHFKLVTTDAPPAPPHATLDVHTMAPRSNETSLPGPSAVSRTGDTALPPSSHGAESAAHEAADHAEEEMVLSERPSLLPKPLLDTTLASLFVAQGGAPLSRHPSGLVRGIARHDAPLAYDPRARFATSEDIAEVDSTPYAFRAGGRHGFLRALSGVLLLRPREPGETLHLLELGDEVLTLDDRFVAAFDARLTTGRDSAPWPLEMLSFHGNGVVVLGLPEPFLSFDLRDSQRFEVPAAAVVGWIGELTASTTAEGPNPWLLPLRFQGNGTLLFLPTPAPGRSARV